jgi:hypothetical protein
LPREGLKLADTAHVAAAGAGAAAPASRAITATTASLRLIAI